MIGWSSLGKLRLGTRMQIESKPICSKQQLIRTCIEIFQQHVNKIIEMYQETEFQKMKSMYFCIFVQKVLVRDEYFSRMRCGVVLIFCGLDFAKNL